MIPRRRHRSHLPVEDVPVVPLCFDPIEDGSLWSNGHGVTWKIIRTVNRMVECECVCAPRRPTVHAVGQVGFFGVEYIHHWWRKLP